MKNEIEISVEWGDTDQAAIMFYPNFSKWFDIGTRHLLDAAGRAPCAMGSWRPGFKPR